MSAKCLKLENRSVLRLSGADAGSFLQGLVTNDVTTIAAGKAVYAALLTPQGKFLYDLILFTDGEDFLLDVERESSADLIRRLSLYKLRADVTIGAEVALSVWACSDAPSGDDIRAGNMTLAPDPRHSDMGYIVVSENAPCDEAWPGEDYHARRISLGIPDGSRDMAREKYFWLETGAEALNGVSFTKGCYIGQELTARMKHRTNLKKMLLPVKSETSPLTEGSAILNDRDKEIGVIHTVSGQTGMAYLRLENLETGLKLASGESIKPLL